LLSYYNKAGILRSVRVPTCVHPIVVMPSISGGYLNRGFRGIAGLAAVTASTVSRALAAVLLLVSRVMSSSAADRPCWPGFSEFG
jgi:uncharacterized membrane protein YtjA (UPF0391 family)